MPDERAQWPRGAEERGGERRYRGPDPGKGIQQLWKPGTGLE